VRLGWFQNVWHPRVIFQSSRCYRSMKVDRDLWLGDRPVLELEADFQGSTYRSDAGRVFTSLASAGTALLTLRHAFTDRAGWFGAECRRHGTTFGSEPRARFQHLRALVHPASIEISEMGIATPIVIALSMRWRRLRSRVADDFDVGEVKPRKYQDGNS
jgi:hypothetical protein